ncbi:MAG: coenzyme-B sulfoethylthiotransferase subunit beta [Candidatus Methanoperedenaceae archaeon]|nr:coenzyme-B sulfoethylthiotransferase subunit beta [Candidatus Methanoperedenaceae archaeon]
MADKIDLYSDRGAKLKSGVDINEISPMRNAAIKKIVTGIKRTAAVDLAGIEKVLATATLGGKGRKIPGREMKLDIVKNAEKIKSAVADMVKVEAGDDTVVNSLNGGKQLIVQVPSARIDVAAEYVASLTCSASAVTQAIIDQFNVGMFDSPAVKSAVWGQYPQTLDMVGGNVKSIVEIPQKDEGFGYTLRNVMANHLAATCKFNAMNTAALCSTLETVGVFEMGDAIGIQERHRLLAYSYQGLNANNMVYGTTKALGKTGTIGTVVHACVEKAIADKVIKADKKFASGYTTYKCNDVPMWNAYLAAGNMIATLVNCGAMRAPQSVSSVLMYFNDLIEKETTLPGCDFGKVQGVAVGFSFFSHSIYGGGGPGTFNGNHVTTRHSKGLGVPCVAAAVALDAGVQIYSPAKTSQLVGDVFSSVDEFREPIKAIAEAV